MHVSRAALASVAGAAVLAISLGLAGCAPSPSTGSVAAQSLGLGGELSPEAQIADNLLAQLADDVDAVSNEGFASGWRGEDFTRTYFRLLGDAKESVTALRPLISDGTLATDYASTIEELTGVLALTVPTAPEDAEPTVKALGEVKTVVADARLELHQLP